MVEVEVEEKYKASQMHRVKKNKINIGEECREHSAIALPNEKAGVKSDGKNIFFYNFIIF